MSKSFGRFLSESVEWVREAEAKAAEAEKPVVGVDLADGDDQTIYTFTFANGDVKHYISTAMQLCDLCAGTGDTVEKSNGLTWFHTCTDCNGSGVVEKPAPADGLTDEARLAYADKLYAEWLGFLNPLFSPTRGVCRGHGKVYSLPSGNSYPCSYCCGRGIASATVGPPFV